MFGQSRNGLTLRFPSRFFNGGGDGGSIVGGSGESEFGEASEEGEEGAGRGGRKALSGLDSRDGGGILSNWRLRSNTET